MAKRKITKRDLLRLTEQFRAFGASDPEGWAESQVEEGIPQYARFGSSTKHDKVSSATVTHPGSAHSSWSRMVSRTA
jgi:hypothetical protein